MCEVYELDMNLIGFTFSCYINNAYYDNFQANI